MTKGIYLDNSATTRPSDKAISRMLPFLTDMWGTPSAPHQMGQELFAPMEESYRSIYKLLGASDKDTVVFTSSGAEAVNHAFLSTYTDVTDPTGRNQYITSNTDEAPALMSMARLEHLGCVGKMVQANTKGQITAENVAETFSPRTALVSLSWANGLTGVINPVSDIAKICKERGVALHLDATHILGKLFFDLEEIQPSFITFNGDHLHAPKGTGALYIKEGVKCSPFILGGLEQGGYRAGSINVPSFIALGYAADEADSARDFMCTEIARLRNQFEEGILAAVPDSQAFFRDQERVPHITAMTFPGISNELLLYALNRKHLFASMGGGSFQQIGLILAASGIDTALANSALSFCLSRETTEDEIDRAISIIAETVKRLRKLSGRL